MEIGAVDVTWSSLQGVTRREISLQFELFVVLSIPAQVISIFHVAESKDQGRNQNRGRIQKGESCVSATTTAKQKVEWWSLDTPPTPPRDDLSVPSQNQQWVPEETAAVSIRIQSREIRHTLWQFPTQKRRYIAQKNSNNNVCQPALQEKKKTDTDTLASSPNQSQSTHSG